MKTALIGAVAFALVASSFFDNDLLRSTGAWPAAALWGWICAQFEWT